MRPGNIARDVIICVASLQYCVLEVAEGFDFVLGNRPKSRRALPAVVVHPIPALTELGTVLNGPFPRYTCLVSVERNRRVEWSSGADAAAAAAAVRVVTPLPPSRSLARSPSLILRQMKPHSTRLGTGNLVMH